MCEIEARTIRKSTRIEIIEAIGRQMWIHTTHPTSSEYTEVCRMIVKKFPVLEHSLGNGIVCIVAIYMILSAVIYLLTLLPHHVRNYVMPSRHACQH